MHLTKISNISRILVAIASLCLIACYFVPLWRIDLFAPQYPEGLTMKIWLTTLKGDVDIINGLNHYIGMKHISVAMFPEFDILIYVVGFYIFLGLLVAYFGKLSILFWYLVFTAFGGVFSMYDFYRWGYEYGHNLDETAAIKVPGLSYQPPLFGHKRLLNFDAYSFPDIGGWIIIIAACIMALIWFFEWYSHHKSSGHKSQLAVLSGLILLTTSCQVKPEPFKLGIDVCHTCKMGIIDPKFGAEFITKKGKVYKFDDIGCMVRLLKSGDFPKSDLAMILAADYNPEHALIEVEKSTFVIGEDVRSPMNFNTATFKDDKAASDFIQGGQNRKSVKWDFIFQNIN